MHIAIEADCRRPIPRTYSPDVVIDRLEAERGEVFVVRDDLLPGGTKQRACAPFLAELAERGYTRFYYASPFAGFAQIALAYLCGELGLECHVYASMDPNARSPSERKHAFTRLAEDHGAMIALVETLQDAERLAYGASRLIEGAYKIPLGFDCLEFRSHLEVELRRQWMRVLAKTGRAPRNLWIPVGSGTLASVFRRIIGPETKLQCIDVRVLSRDDMRIASLAEDPSVGYRATPEKFHEYAGVEAPVPSNAHYDAKLWRFVSEGAEEGDVWWNVAR